MQQVRKYSARTTSTVARLSLMRYATGGRDDQPRVPAGTPEGGQFAPIDWSADPGTTRTRSALPRGVSRGGVSDILELVSLAIGPPLAAKRAVYFADVSAHGAEKLKAATGLDLSGYAHTIAVGDIRHALRRHGPEGVADTSIGQADFEKIAEIVGKPDTVELLSDKDSDGNPLIKFTKRFNGHMVNLVSVRRGREELAFKSLWKSATNAALRPPEEAQQLTSETTRAASSRDSDHDRPSDDEVNKNSRDTKKVMRYSRVDAAAARFAVHYAKSTPTKGQREFRWITIHPHGHAEGTGTPVKIDGQGNIVGGPKALADKGIKKLSDFGKSDPPDARFHARGNEIYDANGVRQAAFRTEDKAKEAAERWNKEGKPGETPTANQSATPDATAAKAPENTKPANQPESRSDGTLPGMDALQPNETPREAAERQQRAIDADYEFARRSSVRNAGEDLKGSARHKRNEWRGLESAEKDGTAAELVTRDNLLKAEPHNLMDAADDNPLTAVTMHFAMRAFPAKPGHGDAKRRSRVDEDTNKKDRSQFLDTYREYKSQVETLAASGKSPSEAIGELHSWVKTKIDDLRGIPREHRGGYASSWSGTDRFNNTANSLVDTLKSLSVGYRSQKNGVAANAEKFSQLAKESYGDKLPDREQLADHVRDVMEGRSIPQTFGQKSAAKKKFDPSELYVKHAVRKGGRDVSQFTKEPNQAAAHILKNFGARGVQWGNSVTDDERLHHAGKLVEALADLADVTGLKPEDLGLGGRMGWAIGARGHGNALAHYEPHTQVINLTRKSGVGALAHEWGHAFDHSIHGFKINAAIGKPDAEYASERVTSQRFTRSPDGRQLVPENQSDDPIWQSFNGIRKAWKESGFDTRLKANLQNLVNNDQLSADKAQKYWASIREKFARSFEKHIQHKLRSQGRDNTYLSGLGESGDDSLWPTDAEAEKMAPAFDQLLAAYRHKKYGNAEPQQYSRMALRVRIAQMLSSPHRYARPDERWITLNGGSAADGEGGGTPVKIDGDGRILAGPQGIADKGIRKLSDFGNKSHQAEASQKRIEDGVNAEPSMTDRVAAAAAAAGSEPSGKLRQVGLFSQSDLGGAPQLFDTGKEFVREKKSTTKPVEAAPSTLEKIDDELKAKVREALPLAGQQSLLGDSSQSTWDNLPRPAIDGFEKNVLVRLRDQVKQLNDIKSRLGQRYAWEVATKRGEKPGDPHVTSAAVERWKQHAKSVGLDAESLVASHPEYQALLQDLDQHRAWGSTPVKKYSRVAMAAARYARETRPTAGQWITIGGSPVHIDDSGKILLGCPGLKGEDIDDLQDESDESRRIREVRQAHAEARGLTGRDVTAGEAKRLASPNKVKQHEVAKEAARGSGHSTASVLRAMSDAHALHADQHTVLRPAINRAMKLTGLTPALARDWENSYRDWSTWPDFDHFARAVVAEHPELGLDRDDHDTPAKLWDLIRNHGKRTAKDELHSPDVARTAVEMLGRPIRGKQRQAPATHDDFDAFDAGDAADDGDGDTSFDPDKFRRTGRVDRVALASGRFALLHH